MRVLDVLIAFPSLVLALAIAQSLGPSKLHTIYALSFFSVPAFARLSRASTLRLRERPFMLAARLAGTRAPRMLLRHVAPNILPQLVTFGLLGIGVTIILEGALSFLGLGVPPPDPSWGNMIFEGQAVLSAEPEARAAAERVPLRHGAGLQHAGRRPARALERLVTSGEAPVDVRVDDRRRAGGRAAARASRPARALRPRRRAGSAPSTA